MHSYPLCSKISPHVPEKMGMLEEKFDKLMEVIMKTVENVEKIAGKIVSLESGEYMLRLENAKLKQELNALRNEMCEKNLIIHDVKEGERNVEEV